MIVKMLVTRLRESKALSISKQTRPNEIEPAEKIFFRKRLIVKDRAKNKEVKNEVS